MLKLMKYLKQFIGSIFLIILLLVLQAVCELSLPQYTSNIVNVGIQQGGIQSSVPDVIRGSSLQAIQIFLNDEEKQMVTNSYEELKKESMEQDKWDSLVKKYPALESEQLYQLKDLDKEQQTTLEDTLVVPLMMIQSIVQQQGEEGVYQISLLPSSQIEQMVEQTKTQLETVGDMLSQQVGVQFVKAEYTAIGVDMDQLQSNYIFIAGAKMILLSLGSMAAAVCVTFFAARVAASLGKNLRGNVFQQVISFSDAEFDKFSTASLITRSTNDIQQVQLLVVLMLRLLFYAPILGIGGVIKVFNTNTSMAWIIGLAVGLIMLVVLFLFTVAMPKFKALQQLIDRLNLVTREILTGIPVIRAFSRERYEEERFDVANRQLTRTNLFVNRVMAGMMPIMMFIMNIVTVTIVWFGAKQIDLAQMQVGDMMAFITYTMQIIMSFLMITMMSVMLPRALVSVRRIDEVLSTKSSIVDKANTKGLKHMGEVCFDNVSFSYKDADENVLEHISFTAKTGETTAIIGSTGSGKSTLVKLIPRFFDVTEGKITIDGVDIRDVSQKELRESIGYVPQKGVLFSGTIESNIKFAHENITDEAMNKAARISQSEEFIGQKPEKYQSPISQGGTNVSGGQKQRLSIARAIAKDPKIYIFDDSFSALDYKTDVALRKALKEETSDATVIIVAQRISTILHADQILVLDNGKIVGKGTHEQLLDTCNVYKQIAQSQLSEEELGKKEVKANE